MRPSRATILSIFCLLALTLAGCSRGASMRNQAPAAAPNLIRDLPYGADPLQRIDVYLPQQASAAPVLFLVHGGGWRTGDKAMDNVVANKVAYWLPKGYIVVSANYRLLPQANPLEQAQDIAAALSFAQAQASSWGGDPARFVLIGHSAGAHLVALLAADPSIAARQGARPWLGTIALDSAALDVAQIMRGPHLPLYDDAFAADPKFWQAASPIDQLHASGGPMLLVCSSRRADSCPAADQFASKAAPLGRQAEVLPIDLGHTEINQQLGLPGPYTGAVASFLDALGLP